MGQTRSLAASVWRDCAQASLIENNGYKEAMHSFITRILQPVKRHQSARYVRIMLTAFAASVIVTRLYLSRTGYPQIGSGTLHIAHVLWGGLLLFAAALLPLVFSNRWVYTAGAILGGLGVGLFIDEVGKFITRSNDYFYPPAASIIYAFFLLTVLVYTQVQRPPRADARTELYSALDALTEVLDSDLDPQERAEMQEHLRSAAERADQPDLARLAGLLLRYLQSDTLHVVPRPPRRWQRWLQRARALEQKWVDRTMFRMVLITGLGLLGLGALFSLTLWGIEAASPGSLAATPFSPLATRRAVSEGGADWFTVRMVLEGAVGFALLIAARFFLTGQDRRGVQLSHFGLLLSLTTVNLLVFYFDQFQAVTATLLQFLALLVVNHYRHRYLLANQGGEADAAP